MLVHEIVERDAEQLRELDQNAHVGNAVALLPFGNGLIGIVEFLRKFELRHVRKFSQTCDILSDDLC